MTADHVGMHAPARHGTHMGGTLRGLLAACASARLDVLVFSSASAFLAVHAAVDSFVAPEPANGATSCAWAANSCHAEGARGSP